MYSSEVTGALHLGQVKRAFLVLIGYRPTMRLFSNSTRFSLHFLTLLILFSSKPKQQYQKFWVFHFPSLDHHPIF